MFSNNIKVIIRNFLRHKWYAGLNLLGLATGFAAFILICIYLYHETHFDNFHSHADRIYRPTYITKGAQGFNVHWARIPVNYINELPEEMPEIQTLIRFQNQERKYVRIGAKKFTPTHAYTTDPEVFEVFDFKLLAGDPVTALAEPHTAVISRELAHRYFGHDRPIGREFFITGNFQAEEIAYQVTGVMEDLPSNTHLPVDMLLSFSGPDERQGWAYVYTLLKEGASIKSVEAKMPDFIATHTDNTDGFQNAFEFQPLKGIHLHSDLAREIIPNGNALYIKIFGLAAFLILAIALINFINLNSALSLGRSKEIGLRKVLGAEKKHNLFYAFSESVTYTLLALSAGVLISYLLFPAFQQLSGASLSLPLGYFALFLLGVAVLGGLLAGIYPALVMNTLHLPQILQNGKTIRMGGYSFNVRRILVGMQFAASIVLIGSALVGYRQIRYLEQKNLGLQKEQIIALPALPDAVTAQYNGFKEKIKAIDGVSRVAACMQVPSEEIRDSGPVLVKGRNDDPKQAPMIDMQVIDADFIDLMDIQFAAGHVAKHEMVWKPAPEFGPELSPQDYLGGQPRTYVINETAMHQLGWDDPEQAIGQEINWSVSNFVLAMGPITGVVKDFHQESLKNEIDPIVMTFEPIWLRSFLIQVNSSEVQPVISQIQAIWDHSFTQYPFEYHFLDELFDKLYRSEHRQIRLLAWLSMLSVIIAGIGLFSLVAYNLQTRLKELAIRQVLGAKLPGLIQLVGKEYLWIVSISAIIAVPVSYYGVKKWLQNFAYHIDVSMLTYGLSLLIILLVLLLIISVQTWWSSRMNPVEHLKE
ncbi:MAG: FtsX-like permease family protein [Saprospiraceae bacterium]|nr:ABC transporter permease [Lewinella sp.]